MLLVSIRPFACPGYDIKPFEGKTPALEILRMFPGKITYNDLYAIKPNLTKPNQTKPTPRQIRYDTR